MLNDQLQAKRIKKGWRSWHQHLHYPMLMLAVLSPGPMHYWSIYCSPSACMAYPMILLGCIAIVICVTTNRAPPQGSNSFLFHPFSCLVHEVRVEDIKAGLARSTARDVGRYVLYPGVLQVREGVECFPPAAMRCKMR